VKSPSDNQPGSDQPSVSNSGALAVASLGTFEWNLRTDAVTLDQRSCEIFGFGSGQGKTAQEVFDRIHPEDFPQVYARAKASVESLSRLDIQYRIFTTRGELRHIASVSYVSSGADGRGDRAFGVFSDITATNEAAAVLLDSEARQAYLLTLAEAVRAIRDPEALKAVASRVLAESLRTNRAFYADVEGDDWVVEGCYARGVSVVPPGRYSAGTYGHRIMATYRAGQRIVFRDVTTDPDFAPEERDAHAAINIIAAIGVPLVKEGKLVAILAVHSAEPRDWTEDEYLVGRRNCRAHVGSSRAGSCRGCRARQRRQIPDAVQLDRRGFLHHRNPPRLRETAG
jgi:hypothetical protein